MTIRHTDGRRGERAGRWGEARILALIGVTLSLTGTGCGDNVYSLGGFTPSRFEVCCDDVPKWIGHTAFRAAQHSGLRQDGTTATIQSVGPSLALYELSGSRIGPGTEITWLGGFEIRALKADFVEERIGVLIHYSHFWWEEIADQNQMTWIVVRNTCPDTPTPDPDEDPAPEPDPQPTRDPTRIVFSSDRDGDSEIFVVAEDGSGLVQLTDNDWEDTDPAWSPDGTQIVFLSNEEALPSWPDLPDLYVMSADGSGAERLTWFSTDGIPVADPDWSPDGSRIAFALLDLLSGIHVLELDAGVTRWITNEDGDRAPAWSPDSTQVAFHRDGDIYLADDVDPLRPAQAHLEHQGYDDAPDWSPNGLGGRSIAYLNDGDLRILIEPDIIEQLVTGGGIRALSWAPVVDGLPAHEIVFVRNGALLVVDVGTRDITSLGQAGTDPNWGIVPP